MLDDLDSLIARLECQRAKFKLRVEHPFYGQRRYRECELKQPNCELNIQERHLHIPIHKFHSKQQNKTMPQT